MAKLHCINTKPVLLIQSHVVCQILQSIVWRGRTDLEHAYEFNSVQSHTTHCQNGQLQLILLLDLLAIANKKMRVNVCLWCVFKWCENRMKKIIV